MEPSAITCTDDRPSVEAFMRRLLRVPAGAGPGQAAEGVFGASLVLSTIRCLLTYIVLPALKPVVDLGGGVGPALGLALGTVSAVAIVAAMRRFWAAGHRWRWGYTAVGGGVLVLLAAQAVGDVAVLFR